MKKLLIAILIGFVSQTVYSKEMSLGKFKLGMSKKELLSVKGVKETDYISYKENRKFGPLEVPLEYWYGFNDNKITRINIGIGKIKKCYKYYGWLYDMIKLHLEKKFNAKLIKNKFEVFGKKYEISSFSNFDDYHLETELEIADKNDCEIEISLAKQNKKNKFVQTINSDIKKYF